MVWSEEMFMEMMDELKLINSNLGGLIKLIDPEIIKPVRKRKVMKKEKKDADTKTK